MTRTKMSALIDVTNGFHALSCTLAIDISTKYNVASFGKASKEHRGNVRWILNEPYYENEKLRD